jgi:hypothetical protein
MTADEKIKLLVEHLESVTALKQEMTEMADKANAEAAKMEAFIEAIELSLEMLRSDLLPL